MSNVLPYKFFLGLLSLHPQEDMFTMFTRTVTEDKQSILQEFMT